MTYHFALILQSGVLARQRHGLILKDKRISCPPHHDYEHGFSLIRSLRAWARRSRSVLFSLVSSFDSITKC